MTQHSNFYFYDPSQYDGIYEEQYEDNFCENLNRSRETTNSMEEPDFSIVPTFIPDEDELGCDFPTSGAFMEEELMPETSEDSKRPAQSSKPTVKPLRMSKIRKMKAGRPLHHRASTVLLDMRFTRRMNADARLLNKVRRTERYWTKKSEVVPNVFRLVTSALEEPFEFLDFSGKGVCPDEPIDVKLFGSKR